MIEMCTCIEMEGKDRKPTQQKLKGYNEMNMRDYRPWALKDFQGAANP
jgi:hypothetical protein